jgi:signal transduction histidine kinase
MELSHGNRIEAEKMAALVQLAGTVAHELNNIFTAVAGNLSLLEQEAYGTSNHAVTIKDVVRAAQRGIDLTAKLQAFAGRQRLHRRSIEFNSLVSRTLDGLKSELAGTTVKRVLANQDFLVYADEHRLAETIVELTKNALAAMPSAAGCLAVKTEQRVQNSRLPYVLLSIADNGCGMTPEVAARAMEPLFTTNPQGIRSGWGLSNCAGFVRQSGGTMRLLSHPGQGTLVEISLPLEN